MSTEHKPYSDLVQRISDAFPFSREDAFEFSREKTLAGYEALDRLVEQLEAAVARGYNAERFIHDLYLTTRYDEWLWKRDSNPASERDLTDGELAAVKETLDR